MAKRSRYLSGARILPPPVGKRMPAAELIEKTFLAYNAGRLREGARLLSERMLKPDVTVGLSLTGALTPAGLGVSCIVPLLKAGFVDWVVSTGANLYHDAHFGLGLPMHAGSPFLDDRVLRDEGVVRIYDVLFDYEVLLDTDAFFRQVLDHGGVFGIVRDELVDPETGLVGRTLETGGVETQPADPGQRVDEGRGRLGVGHRGYVVGYAGPEGQHVDLDVGAPLHEEPGNGATTLRPDEATMPPMDGEAPTEFEPVTMSEVGTKLDLARAYMDMGDPEGARSILDEVVQEGSASQKQEAERLLQSLPG
ncbi:MAG: hypothetical protein B7Z74_00150 [Deltaproteobacteria bacterium 21-66-5]|nr:MAG: hypothetical protein B7Z74_00150 [Deltaproteobacteria bacterium 21-66-5]